MSDQTTEPNLASLLEEMRAGFASVDKRLTAIENRLSAVEHQLENMDMRLDAIESFAHQTRSEILALRLSFKQSRTIEAGGQHLSGGFIRRGMRADEGSSYDDSAEQVRLLAQRVEELEKRLSEGASKRGQG